MEEIAYLVGRVLGHILRMAFAAFWIVVFLKLADVIVQ